METKVAAQPFSMLFVIPGTDKAEIRRQFSRVMREFSPSRIEICIDDEKGMSIATVEFPPTEEGRRNVEAYQRMRSGTVLVNSSSAEKEPPERDGAIGLHGTFSQGGRN
jgi:hypothetical protein